MLNGPKASFGAPDHAGSRSDDLLRVDVSVANGALAAREALNRFMLGIGPLNLDIEETSTIQLVLAEIINNILEHAYPPNGPDGAVKITGICRQDGMHLRIRDTGLPMPDGELPLGGSQSLDVNLADLPEGGFGWFLIRDLARDLAYSRIGDENHLTLRIAIPIG